MKKAKLVVILALSLVLLLVLALAMVTYAQGPEGEEEGVRSQEEGGVGGLGLADPPPAGYSVLYMFTGAANDNDGTDRIATVVHCTNFGSSSVEVEVQMFSWSAYFVYTRTQTIGPNETYTYASQRTNIYYEDVDLHAGYIKQGSGRVVATGSDVICTGQVVDPDSDQPSFMAKLPLFDSSGHPVGGKIPDVYLPIILMNH